MAELGWRDVAFAEAVGRPELRDRAVRAAAAGPLCDPCLGRLFAGVGTGLRNEARGHTIRRAAGLAAAAGSCSICHGFFGTLDAWTARIRDALAPWEFDTFVVSSHPDPAIASREKALWDLVGGDLAEPYKQQFNREVGVRLADALGKEPDLVQPDVAILADHATGEVTVRPQPLFAAGRYRKLVRGIPQCRWAGWPTSVQQIIGDPVCRAAEAADHEFHGAGREDVDVRCLGERPFALEILRPRRRRLDWAALAAEINASGQVEVLDFAPCGPDAPARLKALRPDKSYRALVRLEAAVPDEALGRLAALRGPVRQRTPRRVLKRRVNLVRVRRVVSVEWRRIDPRTIELALRTSSGLYIKELISGDQDRTRPSVAALLGVPAACAELDVMAIHLA